VVKIEKGRIEDIATGVNFESTTLSLPSTIDSNNVGSEVIVALRFRDIAIDQGWIVYSASIQFASFAADDTSGSPNIRIYAHKIASAGSIPTSSGSISALPATSAYVVWTPAAWSGAGLVGAAQNTVDISPVIQELLNQPLWNNNNEIVILMKRHDVVPLMSPSRRRATYKSGTTPILTITAVGSSL
jgi:hypothetical protein